MLWGKSLLETKSTSSTPGSTEQKLSSTPLRCENEYLITSRYSVSEIAKIIFEGTQIQVKDEINVPKCFVR